MKVLCDYCTLVFLLVHVVVRVLFPVSRFSRTELLLKTSAIE